MFARRPRGARRPGEIALLGALTGTVVLGTAAGASAAPSGGGPLATALAGWTAGHPATGAVVWRLDEDGAKPILSYKPATPRRPASTMKVITAASTLMALGPDFRFETRLYAGVNSRIRARTLAGPVYLKGYGDPVLSTPRYAKRFFSGYGGNIGKLVRPVKALGVRRVRGPIVVDESFFDSVRTGPQWLASYRFECPPLSALPVNQDYAGEVRGRYVRNPATAPGGRLRDAMRAVGVRFTGAVRPGHAPARGRLLATVQSPPLHVITRLMLPESDNFIAETLLKNLGAYTRDAGTSAAGTATERDLLSQRALIQPGDRFVDGSGLSRANRVAPETMVGVLAAADADPTWGRALVRSLARGGEGTLVHRLRTPDVRNRVRAKTGFINSTAALVGLVTSRSGVRYAFAFLMNDGDIGGAHRTQDTLVTLLARGAGDRLEPLSQAPAAATRP